MQYSFLSDAAAPPTYTFLATFEKEAKKSTARTSAQPACCGHKQGNYARLFPILFDFGGKICAIKLKTCAASEAI